jgi:uncharacterized membrane protein YkvA (DUF1232 family)
MPRSGRGFERYFSDAGFWDKLTSFARVAGREVIEKALWLYYAMQSPDCPAWAKTVIIGALGYFILPLDAIPDVLVPMGFTDDLGVLAAALTVVSMHVTPEVKRQASQKWAVWFE